jgi:hypothetical protein
MGVEKHARAPELQKMITKQFVELNDHLQNNKDQRVGFKLKDVPEEERKVLVAGVAANLQAAGLVGDKHGKPAIDQIDTQKGAFQAVITGGVNVWKQSDGCKGLEEAANVKLQTEMQYRLETSKQKTGVEAYVDRKSSSNTKDTGVSLGDIAKMMHDEKQRVGEQQVGSKPDEVAKTASKNVKDFLMEGLTGGKDKGIGGKHTEENRTNVQAKVTKELEKHKPAAAQSVTATVPFKDVSVNKNLKPDAAGVKPVGQVQIGVR